MKTILILGLLLAALHPFSYARYNWRKQNRLGAVGAALLAVSVVIIPSWFLLFWMVH